MGAIIGFLVTKGLSEKMARAVAFAGLALAIIGLLAGAKCAYDASVIDRYTTKQEAKQTKRERKADANLEEQRRRDEAAAAQRKAEIDNATRNIPDQAPSARQRARACLELRRQAQANGRPVASC